MAKAMGKIHIGIRIFEWKVDKHRHQQKIGSTGSSIRNYSVKTGYTITLNSSRSQNNYSPSIWGKNKLHRVLGQIKYCFPIKQMRVIIFWGVNGKLNRFLNNIAKVKTNINFHPSFE